MQETQHTCTQLTATKIAQNQDIGMEIVAKTRKTHTNKKQSFMQGNMEIPVRETHNQITCDNSMSNDKQCERLGQEGHADRNPNKQTSN